MALTHERPHPDAAPPATFWVDLLLIVALLGLIGAVVGLARRWTAPLRPAITIDLSPWALPRYTLLSLARGWVAYGLSLLFTLIYGTVAAHNRRAERVMVPLLDILQSIPVLGFLPGLVIGLVALFPHSNMGLELASVVMIFTGQVWNMTFSFYGSLRAIPVELHEVARVHRFGWWQRFRTVEVSSAAIGLVWNSMMSMAGGWFFLTVTEAFTLGNHDFRLPGIGSYMSVAIERGDVRAMLWAVVAMVVMIVAVDQLVWRPVTAWAQKFKVEETEAAIAPQSRVLNLLRRVRARSHLLQRLARLAAGSGEPQARRPVAASEAPAAWVRLAQTVSGWAATLLFAAGVAWGALHLLTLIRHVSPAQWLTVVTSLGLTFARTSVAVLMGALWAVPVGVWIGLSPRWSRRLQPVIQVVAAFPAPMLFPLVTAAFLYLGISFSWGCVVLMLLGAQWYILFNVLAGATAIPQDLREAADVYGVRGWARWRTLYLPGIFPQLVTGLVTAAGGAWNASIVSEFMRYKGQTLIAPGLGSLITEATTTADFPLLTSSVLTMALALVVLNRLLWKRLYRLADTRCSLNR